MISKEINCKQGEIKMTEKIENKIIEEIETTETKITIQSFVK